MARKTNFYIIIIIKIIKIIKKNIFFNEIIQFNQFNQVFSSIL
jgi:hypothetical protein